MTAGSCALESDDGSQVRLDELYAIIAECRYGIHDLSRVTLDTAIASRALICLLSSGSFLEKKELARGKTAKP